MFLFRRNKTNKFHHFQHFKSKDWRAISLVSLWHFFQGLKRLTEVADFDQIDFIIMY